MKEQPSIRINNLSITLGKRRILRSLDIDLHRGECVLLSGDNGAGKTTLMRIVAGLLPPNTCYCRLPDYRNQTDWKATRRWLLKNIVYLHQDPFIFDASVRDNILYGLLRRGISKTRAVRIVDETLDWSGLTHLANRNGARLSGGEKQRVALLRAWVLNPALLLLDEPIANMDEGGRHSTLFLIRRLIRNGAGILITAHEPRLFLPMADRHLHLREGTLHTAPEFVPEMTFPRQYGIFDSFRTTDHHAKSHD
ncbi:MAG: ABC transporter ATP-binding protein [Gammaproteobacteria bacterium]